MNKKLMRIVALTLSVIIILMSPLDSYASIISPIASSSDSSLDFEESEYMPENIITRYEESFTYCPDTLEDVLNSTSRIALPPVVIYVLTLILSACGIYVTSEDIVTEIFTSFENWLRMSYGNNSSIMITWREIQVATLGTAIAGIKTFIPIFKKYLNSSVSGYGTTNPELSFSTGVGALKNGPYSIPGMDYLALGGKYISSIVSPFLGEHRKYDMFLRSSSTHKSYVFYYYKTTSNCSLQILGIDENNKVVDKVPLQSAWVEYIPSDSSYIYSNPITGIAATGFEFWKSSSAYGFEDCLQSIVNTSIAPVFKSSSYAKGYLQYGTLDGLVKPDPDYVFTPSKSWTDLQIKSDSEISYGDNLTVPDTDEALQRILDALGVANTSKEVADALAPSLTITETSESGGESGGDTSILGILNSMLTAMLALPLKIGVEVAKALNLDSLVSGLDDVLSRISQWDFADWKVALGSSLLLALDKAFVAIGLDGVASTLLRIAQWDFSDWTTALGATLVLSLSKGFSAIGLDKVSEALLKIAQWDFADWKTALGATLLLSLTEFASMIGLGDAVGILISIRDWVSSIPDILLAIKDFLLTLPSLLALEFTSLLKALFVPVNNPFNTLKDLFEEKFPIIGQLKSLFKSLIFGSDDGIPRFEFTYMGVTVNIFDLAWLMAFLPWIHALIIALCWYRYLSRLYKRLPAIIGGFQI